MDDDDRCLIEADLAAEEKERREKVLALRALLLIAMIQKCQAELDEIQAEVEGS